MQTTRVDFSKPSSALKARLVQVLPMADHARVAVICENTNFHPVDYQWPDQPADKGHIEVNGQNFDVIDCCLAAFMDAPDKIYLHQDIPVKRGTDQWQFLVAHVVEDPAQFFLNNAIQDVVLNVDTVYRQGLSVAHSVCHLMALALNKVSRPYWKNDPDRIDSLGNPDLDSFAITSSKISDYQSIDCYRFGKSLRKKGFNAAEFLLNKETIADQIQQQITAWLSKPLTIQLASFPSLITDKRVWQCQLPEGLASIPCGGTHVENFSIVAQVHVECASNADQELTITTEVKSRI